MTPGRLRHPLPVGERPHGGQENRLIKAWWTTLGDRLFSRDRHTRIRVQQTLVASGLTVLGGTAVVYLDFVGIGASGLAVPWIGLMVAFETVFYVAIRSGWTRRLRDPALTEPQMVHAIVQTTLSYLLAGEARGVFLLPLMLSTTFGLFSLTTRQMWRMVAFSMLLIAIAMVLGAALMPAYFDPQIERANFIVAMISLPAMGMVASRLNRLRERLREQKQELAQALQRIEILATRDELTGLINRRQMVELLAQQHQRSVRSGHGFCIAVFDIDHFKRINDGHGHPAGDRVLRAFGAELGMAIRLSDVLARWGGEEFLLLMPDTAPTLARVAVERLRERTEAMRVPVGDGTLLVTVSAGVTQHRAGESIADTIARADIALYEAKANGRNQVIAG